MLARAPNAAQEVPVIGPSPPAGEGSRIAPQVMVGEGYRTRLVHLLDPSLGIIVKIPTRPLREGEGAVTHAGDAERAFQ
jgi:hypothetical protein